MRIFYDTEFLEDGRTIDLISIGMVADDGRELYLISRDAPLQRIAVHEWLMDNVVPSLPLALDECGLLSWNTLHPDWQRVTNRAGIARLVGEFIQATPEPELWAWYGAYDHVALAQLWGPMIQLPNDVPMWTNDLKQECVRLGDPRMPKQDGGVHNALADARHVKVMFDHLDGPADTNQEG